MSGGGERSGEELAKILDLSPALPPSPARAAGPGRQDSFWRELLFSALVMAALALGLFLLVVTALAAQESGSVGLARVGEALGMMAVAGLAGLLAAGIYMVARLVLLARRGHGKRMGAVVGAALALGTLVVLLFRW